MMAGGNTKVIDTCYQCGEPSVSEDHVPPKAFFPKEKEAPGFRGNLVKVPACAEHNMARSADDEYVAALFVVGVQHDRLPEPFVQRVMRALTRGERPLGERMLSRSERVQTARGPTAAVSLERGRLEAVLLATAHGLLFDLDGRRTVEELSVYEEAGPFGTRRTGSLEPHDATAAFAPLLQKLQARGEAVRGDNPSMFSYMATRDLNRRA